MKVEFRSWITVPGLPHSAEQDHERLFEVLRRDFGKLGPVMSWAGEGWTATEIVLATDADDESMAAAEMVGAVASSLQGAGLGHLYPATIEIELVRDELVPV